MNKTTKQMKLFIATVKQLQLIADFSPII